MKLAHSSFRAKRGVCFFLLSIASSLFAGEITGTVTNRTTGKAAAGDEVVLLKLQEGMQEVARTKTDSRGRFTLTFSGEAMPHLVRVRHAGVNYHRPAPPNTTSVEVEVFDAAEKVSGLRQTVDVMRLEADATNLQVIEMYAVQNDSRPPRTQMGPKNFEIELPGGATIQQTIAAGPGGMPVTSAPVPAGEKDRYVFIFPLRPGETRFQVAYTLPYGGSATLSPKLLRPSDDFAVSAPTSMTIMPSQGSRLERRGEDAGMTVYVAQNAQPGQPLGFTVTGTGVVPREQNGAPGSQQAGSNGRPGGGIGTPANTPDPLYKYRWWIIGAVALALVAGAAYRLSRGNGPAATVMDRESLIQDAIKNELFELESDRLQNRISAEEYAQVKAGLERLLSRVMTRRAKA